MYPEFAEIRQSIELCLLTLNSYQMLSTSGEKIQWKLKSLKEKMKPW